MLRGQTLRQRGTCLLETMYRDWGRIASLTVPVLTRQAAGLAGRPAPPRWARSGITGELKDGGLFARLQRTRLSSPQTDHSRCRSSPVHGFGLEATGRAGTWTVTRRFLGLSTYFTGRGAGCTYSG